MLFNNEVRFEEVATGRAVIHAIVNGHFMVALRAAAAHSATDFLKSGFWFLRFIGHICHSFDTSSIAFSS